MPVYMVIEIQVHDPKQYAEYMRLVPETVKQYGGRYLVRGSPLAAPGDWKPERMVILEFEDAAALRRWNTSPEYRAVAPLREAATTTRAIVLEGYTER
jgi:uncharacterized protein (DUF1330 family)